MEEVPKWYCPFRLPEAFVGTVKPLVFLHGLDLSLNPVHRGIWEILSLQSHIKDFDPTYIPLNVNYTLPHKKQKRDGLETYIPPGIIPSGWAKKHREQIPAVLVAFFNFSWTEGEWKERKEQTAQKVKQLREECGAHGTQLLVMLIKSGASDSEDLSTERASALCAAAELPPKCLYILAHPHPDRIQTCVHRLENGMREAVKNYYSTRVRRIRNWKDKATQAPLILRYNFKLGFFQEIRRDYVAAMSHYESGMEGLLSIRVTDANVQELKVIASILNYRICRLHFLRMETKEAKTQFDKLIRSFYRKEGNPELMFEHIAWLERQHHNFGELSKQYYRVGWTNVCDPVTYFLTAAKYAEQRAKYVEERIRVEGNFPAWPTEMDLFRAPVDLRYLGQRPWRFDSFGPESTYVVEEPRCIQALKYFEAVSLHSKFIIDHLGVGSNFCKDTTRQRTRCQLMSAMGVEFYRNKEYANCILVMTNVLHEFGAEKWLNVIHHVAEIGLKAACALGDVSAYISFLVILLKVDLRSFVGPERIAVLWSNLLAVFNKKLPVVEPEIQSQMDVERWQNELDAPIISYVRVHLNCIVDAHITFAEETVAVHCPTTVKFTLKNRLEFPLTIRKLKILTNVTEYNCEKEEDLTLEPGEEKESCLEFTPLPRDIGKLVQIQVGYVDIGTKDCSVLLHYSLMTNSNTTLWNDWPKENPRLNVVKVEGGKAGLMSDCKFQGTSILVGESHRILFRWTNTDTKEITRLALTSMVGTSDPQQVKLRPEENAGSVGFGHLSHSAEVYKLESGKSHEIPIYLQTWNKDETELKLIMKGRYVDSNGQPATVEHATVIPVVSPLNLTQWTTDLAGEPLSVVSPHHNFLMHYKIQNAADCSLNLRRVQFKILSPNYECLGGGNLKEGILLKPEETVTSFQMMKMVNLQNNDDRLAQLEVTWARSDDVEGSSLETETTLELERLICDEGANSLYLRSENSEGRLKSPMVLTYLLVNRSTNVYDLSISMDSNDYFMNAGPKKLNVKLNGCDHAELSYILFPLKTGLVAGPKLNIEHATAKDPPIPLVIHRDVPKTLFIPGGTMSTDG